MQRKLRCLILFNILTFFLIESNNELPQRASITLIIPKGRLGNKLIALAKAIYVAQKHNLRILIPPFEYSDEFLFSELKETFMPGDEKNYRRIIYIKRESDITDHDNPEILYQLDFYFNLNLPLCAQRDSAFKKILNELIKPKKALTLTQFPAGKTVIGIHIRTGGTYDKQTVIKKFPHKFPPLFKYILALKRLLSQIKGQPIHVHIFTDDCNPEELVSKIKRAIRQNISFSCRKESNNHDANVLEDLFSMAHCDYLIRPHSTYSIIAQIIGHHKRVIQVGLS